MKKQWIFENKNVIKAATIAAALGLTACEGTSPDPDDPQQNNATANNNTPANNVTPGNNTSPTTREQALVQMVNLSEDSQREASAESSLNVYANGELLIEDLATHESSSYLELDLDSELQLEFVEGDRDNGGEVVGAIDLTGEVEDGDRLVITAMGDTSAEATSDKAFRVETITDTRVEGEGDGDATTLEALFINDTRGAGTIDVMLDGETSLVSELDATSHTSAEGGGALYLEMDRDDARFEDKAMLDVWANVEGSSEAELIGSFELDYDSFADESVVIAVTGSMEEDDLDLVVFSSAKATAEAEGEDREEALSLENAARLQIVHNSPDRDAEMVDVWADGKLLLDDFEFRSATSFISAPADDSITVSVASSSSSDASDAMVNFDVMLAEGSTSVAVASGVMNSSDQEAEFDLLFHAALEGKQESDASGKIDVLFHQGSPDADEMTLEVSSTGNALFEELEYGEFEGYSALDADLMANIELLDLVLGLDLSVTSENQVDFSDIAGDDGRLIVMTSGSSDVNAGVFGEDERPEDLAILMVNTRGETRVVSMQ